MSLASALSAQRTAADAFKAAALAVSDSLWNTPRAAGKWSPAQVTDHVGVATRVARDAVAMKSGIGSIPSVLRPLARALFLKPALKKGFPKKRRGPAIFAPAHDPMPRAELIAKIDSEVAAFENDTRALEKAGTSTFIHGFFGEVSLADYVMFNALHFDHHREQLPVKS